MQNGTHIRAQEESCLEVMYLRLIRYELIVELARIEIQSCRPPLRTYFRNSIVGAFLGRQFRLNLVLRRYGGSEITYRPLTHTDAGLRHADY